MAKYLATVKYTQKGLQGLLQDGGTKRRQVVDKLIESLGGKVEAFYYAFGDADLYVLIDGADNIGAATASLVVTAAGGANVSITVLLTPEEIDQVAKKSVPYTAPGQ